uniref:MOR2-PAG1_C domain-containing protein n=1 Tax=Schistocephalus solidus TaxID=70667 RepID=A0A183SA73_SCHSO
LEIAIRINEKLMKAVLCAQEAKPHSTASKSPTPPTDTTDPTVTGELDVSAVLRVTYVMFEHASVLTRLSALRWVEVLVDVFPNSVVRSSISLVGHLCRHPAASKYTGTFPPHQGSLCPAGPSAKSLSQLVTASSQKVVEANGFCLHFLLDLANLLLRDRDMLKHKGELIITLVSCEFIGRQIKVDLTMSYVWRAPSRELFLLCRALVLLKI